ncbi:MAG: peptidase S10 [Vulcanimicrobiaceae bacterium]
MHRTALALTLCALTGILAGAPGALRAQSDPAPAPTPTPRPVPHVPDAITHHTIVLGGRSIAYTAHAGTIVLRDADGLPTASVFAVAYTADAADPRTRPVTFFWNGGPGSSTIWLHMGSFGPVRVAVPANAAQPAPGAPLVANPFSLLDTSDLVFIDAIGTGWSTIVGKATPKDFYGIDEDAKAFTQYIERWLTANARWQSPKFLFGESYGTTRAANVVNKLQDDGVAMNGVVLLSSALDYNFLPVGQGPGEDYPYIGYLPTEAAVAWYHHRVPGNPPDLVRFVAQARAFAGGPYAAALRRGDTLDPATRAQIVARLHAFTGLSASYIEAANLRLDPNRFQLQLLRDEGRNLGRYDGRYEGDEMDPNSAYPSYDPSDTMVSAAYVAAFNHYVHDELQYRETRPYEVLSFAVNSAWNSKRGDDASAPSVVGDLQAALAKNPSLHVLSANGYFDLATGFYGTEYLLQHMNLNAAQQKQVQFAYFRSGHMVYLNPNALVEFKRVLVGFYRGALAH